MMKHITSACPYCEAWQSSTHLVVTDHWSGEPFHVHRCATCAGLYLKDPPPSEEISDYYQNILGEMMWKKPNPIFSWLNAIALKRDFKPLVKRLTPRATVLDIGAGSGASVCYLKQKQLVPFALDIYNESDWVHQHIPYRRVNLTSGQLSWQDIYCDGKTPDAIVMRHVLEHLYRPLDVLRMFSNAGVAVLLIIVPNSNSRLSRFFSANWYYWDPPRHLTFFTRGSLEFMLNRAGYQVQAFCHYGIDEVVTSLFRRRLLANLRDGGSRRIKYGAILQPKSVLAALSSALCCWNDTVCWCLAEKM